LLNLFSFVLLKWHENHYGIIVTRFELHEFEFLSFITAASNYIIATQNNN